MGILVSYCCHNKLSQTSQLETAQLCHLTALWARSAAASTGSHEADVQVLAGLCSFPEARGRIHSLFIQGVHRT